MATLTVAEGGEKAYFIGMCSICTGQQTWHPALMNSAVIHFWWPSSQGVAGCPRARQLAYTPTSIAKALSVSTRGDDRVLASNTWNKNYCCTNITPTLACYSKLWYQLSWDMNDLFFNICQQDFIISHRSYNQPTLQTILVKIQIQAVIL